MKCSDLNNQRKFIYKINNIINIILYRINDIVVNLISTVEILWKRIIMCEKHDGRDPNEKICANKINNYTYMEYIVRMWKIYYTHMQKKILHVHALLVRLRVRIMYKNVEALRYKICQPTFRALVWDITHLLGIRIQHFNC